jgi:hypothetical protein
MSADGIPLKFFFSKVESFGWGNWVKVSDYVETRSPEQLRSSAGFAYKIEPNYLPILEKHVLDLLIELTMITLTLLLTKSALRRNRIDNVVAVEFAQYHLFGGK